MGQSCFIITLLLLGKHKKKVLLVIAGPLRGGGGVKGRAIMEKIIFWHLFFQRSNLPGAMKLEGGWGLGLNGQAIKRRTFFAASLKQSIILDLLWCSLFSLFYSSFGFIKLKVTIKNYNKSSKLHSFSFGCIYLKRFSFFLQTSHVERMNYTRKS